MNKRSGVVHATAECDDCGWSTGYYKNALANGAQHAQRTGHTVRWEQALAGIYNPKPRDDDR